MAYQEITQQPGLLEGERAFSLEEGTRVAVSVEMEWLANNEGMVGKVRSRWIDDEGETQLTAQEQPVVVETSHSFSISYLERHTPELLQKQLILIALGEPPDSIGVTNADKTTSTVPLLNLGEEGHKQASIRTAAKLAKVATRRGDVIRLLKVAVPKGPPNMPAAANRP
jgi:hypothetical protein